MAIKKVCAIEIDDAEYILNLLKEHRDGLTQWGEWMPREFVWTGDRLEPGEFIWKDAEAENEYHRVLEIIDRMEN